MENNLNFICNLCNKQLEIDNGKFIFMYNIKCKNGHKKENIYIDDLLSKKKKNEGLYKCIKHNKKISSYCMDCNKDICLICLNEEHKAHKSDYLKSFGFNDYQLFTTKNILQKEKEIIKLFLSKIQNFQNKFISHINILKSLLIKENKLRQDIINNILNKYYSSIDIKNAKKILSNSSYEKINRSISNFCKSRTFIEQYSSLKNLFEEAIEKGKYIENKYILNIVNKFKLKLIPLNKNYYIHLNDIENDLEIIREKTKPNLSIFEYEILFKRRNDYNIEKIILKNNINIEDELSFFIITNSNYRKELKEIIITNLKSNDPNKIDYIINHISLKDYSKEFINFFILSDNKYIVFNSNGDIYLYDNLFEEKKIIKNTNNEILDFFKIDDNKFAYSLFNDNSIYLININNNLIDNFSIPKSGNYFINYFERKKILFTRDKNRINLINFNNPLPEVIQTLEITDLISQMSYYENTFIHLDKTYYLFEDEVIFVKIIQNSFENDKFYDIIYLVQYKLLEKELKEISRIELDRKISNIE